MKPRTIAVNDAPLTDAQRKVYVGLSEIALRRGFSTSLVIIDGELKILWKKIETGKEYFIGALPYLKLAARGKMTVRH